MVTGFSFVLYSRLHLLNPSKTTLRVILAFIIVDAVLFHGPVIISTIVGNVHFTETASRVFDVASFTEIAFSVQETVLAGLYIYFFLNFTRDSRAEPETIKTLRLLVCAECVVLSVDVVLNVLLYEKLYLPRAMIQAFSSMLKLKIEFIVLNSLVDFSQSRSSQVALQSWHSRDEGVGHTANPVVSMDRKVENDRVLKRCRSG
jgi:hypothetical protein